MPTHRRRPPATPPAKTSSSLGTPHGSLPQKLYPPPHFRSDGAVFGWLDRRLDTTRTGPMYLKQDPIAELVASSTRRGELLNHYELHCHVILSNHVHMLVTPLAHTSRFMKSLKRFTAREADQIPGRSVSPFWQAESYGQWVRNADEWHRIEAYIENNPVRAGLAHSPEEYRWSSAYVP